MMGGREQRMQPLATLPAHRAHNSVKETHAAVKPSLSLAWIFELQAPEVSVLRTEQQSVHPQEHRLQLSLKNSNQSVGKRGYMGWLRLHRSEGS